MKKLPILKVLILLMLLYFIPAGCVFDNYYNTIIEVAPRPTFEQVFVFYTVEAQIKDEVEIIYEAMTDEELVDLKYNYFSPIPVFGIKNNVFNPQDTIQYSGNAIYIRGTPGADNFESLFLAALEAYKNDILNKI